MAVTNTYSNEYTDVYLTNPPTLQRPSEWGGSVRVASFTQTATGAGDTGSTITLVKLPPGKIRMLVQSSVIQSTMSGTVDIGWSAHTNVDGTAVAADADGLVDGQTLSTATLANFTSVAALIATGGVKDFDSKEGVDIILTFVGAGVASSDITSGYIQYVEL